MAFELTAISEDELPMVKEKYRLHIGSYRGKWVVDPESSDCLLFEGRDYLDPTVPSLFVLLNRNRQEYCYFEIVEMHYCATRHIEGFLSPDDREPDYVVVLKSNEGCKSNPDIIKTKICDAMRVLKRNVDLQFLFIPRWGRFY
jgi:hypothetical protein